MLPPDRLADLLPQEARTHPERPDFPSVAVLMPDRICRAAGSRWKGRRHGRPLRCCIAKGWPFCRGLARSQSATRLRLGWPAPVGRSASVTSEVRGCGLKRGLRELNTLGVEPVSYMGSLRWIRHEPRIGAGLASGHPLIRAFMRPVLAALNVLGRSAHVEASVSYGLLY